MEKMKNKIKDMLETLNTLQKQYDPDALKEELKSENVQISDHKYSVAFSLYGASKRFMKLSVDDMKDEGMSDQIPDHAIEAIKSNAALILRLYTCFVYMRSETLEEKLKTVDKESAPLLSGFNSLFERNDKDEKNKKNKEMTIPQHIRNSLSHGTFIISDNKIDFHDYDKKFELEHTTLESLCELLLKFYYCGFELANNINMK